ncbi:hypothetical protein ACVW1C_007770 [Bradyrhizobium sp. USDA 4011]
MSNQTPDAFNAHMLTYRHHLHRLNRDLAEEYISQHSHYLSMAVDELAKAAPVALAIADLHDAIRRSPARNFWPMIREAKGALYIRSTDAGPECPSPWRRTHGGTMRYDLPGYLLFSPFPANFRRIVHAGLRGLQGLTDRTRDLTSEADVWVAVLADAIFWRVLGVKHLIPKIKAFQGFATPDSVAALDRWSNEQQRGSSIVLRISQGMLVYSDGADRCEIEIPDALSAPLCVPSVPVRFERHWIRAGDRAYL